VTVTSLRSVAVAAVLALSASCAPSPPPNVPPPVDDPEAGIVTPPELCSHLAELGCPEGRAPGCAEKVAQVVAARLTNLHASSLMRATSRAEVRRVGTVACPDP